MRLHTIANVLASAAVVAANPLAEKLQRDEPAENKTVIVEKIVYECPKISPKVFIISMASLGIFN
jgi:hypothetical protein